MPRILKAYDPFTLKTLQSASRNRVLTAGGATASAIEFPKSAVIKKGRQGRLQTVRRLSRHDPYNMNSLSGPFATGATSAIMSPVADQFTNNPNPKFDPSKAPGQVTKIHSISRVNQTPGKARRGHGNAIARTLFNQNQGKRLRRL